MNCETMQELLPLLVTGALDPAEESAVRAHLATGCPACAAELAALEASLHQLPLALPAQAAPGRAWEHLEARIAADQRRAAATGPSDLATSADPDRAVLAAPFKPRPRSSWLPWAIAAALAIVAGVAFKNAADTRRDMTAQMATVNQDFADLQQLYDLSSENYKTAIAQLRAIQETATTEEKNLAAGTQKDIKGKALWDKQQNTLTLIADNAAPVAPGKIYELWIVTANGTKLAAGTATPDATGKLTFHTNMPVGTIPTLAAVTDEDHPQPDNGGKGDIQFLAQL